MGSHPGFHFVAVFIFFMPYPRRPYRTRIAHSTTIVAKYEGQAYRYPPLSSWSLESSWVSLFRLFYMFFSPLQMRRGVWW